MLPSLTDLTSDLINILKPLETSEAPHHPRASRDGYKMKGRSVHQGIKYVGWGPNLDYFSIPSTLGDNRVALCFFDGK